MSEKNTIISRSKHAVRDEIREILHARAKALVCRDYSHARQLTERLIECFVELGENSPPLQLSITYNGKTKWFSGFNHHGEAFYSEERKTAVLPLRLNATAQRGETGEHRLAREYVVELAHGSFGYPDELQGQVLSRLASGVSDSIVDILLGS